MRDCITIDDIMETSDWRKKTYTVEASFRLSADLSELLEIISEYEYRAPRKRSELLRRWVGEKVKTYLRNPQFKRWLKMRYPTIYERELGRA